MASKACKGCNQNFEVYDKESRRQFSLHINGCEPYKQMREAQFKDAETQDRETKENTFIHILHPHFDHDKAKALFEAIEFYLEK